jgi:hypothetical protein
MRPSLLLFIVLAWLPSAFSSWFLGQRESRRREEQYGHAVCAVGSAGAGYTVAGRLTTRWQPGGMAYYKLRRPLLAPEQRLAAALAAAAVGMAAARALTEGDGEMADVIRSIGRPFARVVDSIKDKKEQMEQRRRTREREEWLRMHTKQAKIYRPEY